MKELNKVPQGVTPHLGEMVAQKVSRRGILKLTAFAGAGAVVAPGLAAATTKAAEPVEAQTQAEAILKFSPIAPTLADELVLPSGYGYNVIRSWGDYVVGGEKFGFNNDYIAYFPIDLLSGGKSSTDGLLWVNHEYVSPMFVSGRAGDVNPTFAQLIEEKAAVGGTVMRVRKSAGGSWEFVDDPTYNRRVTAWTLIDLDGPAAGSPDVFGATEVQGTLANCAGGYTPWGTALSAEENFQDYGPDASKGGYGWGKTSGDNRFFTEQHYGWIVEIDPFDKSRKPVKHTALGRFRHENATVTLSSSGKAVVYMGYDKADECVFKFISKGTYNPGNREANLKLLSEGTLYAADFANGKWISLDIASQSKLQEKYKTQAAVLVNAGEAAKLVGATPTDRPEDIDVNPADKSVFIAFTNNAAHSNFHGHITRLVETGSDAESLSFDWEVYATGGGQKDSGFSSPDNLIFDKNNNLWVFCDVSSNRAGKGIYKFAGNNGIYVIPTSGPQAGVAYRFGSGPAESELTGPAFTPDFSTLFLSVQHPGEDSPSMDKLTSHWPGGGSEVPRPSVVAITGFKL